MGNIEWKRFGKKVFVTFSCIFLIIVCWYISSRLVRQRNNIHIYQIFHQASNNRASANNQLTIASFNIAHGRGSDSDVTNWQKQSTIELIKHLKAIAEQIRLADVDIVVLNEVDFSCTWSRNINQSKLIAWYAGYRYIAEQRNFDVSFPLFQFRFGNAILSRFPFQKAQFIDFPAYSRLEDAFAGNHDGIFGVVQTPFGQVGIIAVHLEYRSEEVRVRCAKQIIKWNRKFGFPVIAAGDFNSTPDGFPGTKHTDSGENAMDIFFNNKNYKRDTDIFGKPDYFTFPSEQPGKVIDWIVGKGSIKLSEAAVVTSDLSDHLMVTAILEMNQ